MAFHSSSDCRYCGEEVLAYDFEDREEREVICTCGATYSITLDLGRESVWFEVIWTNEDEVAK
jgi:hypothetical protein